MHSPLDPRPVGAAVTGTATAYPNRRRQTYDDVDVVDGFYSLISIIWTNPLMHRVGVVYCQVADSTYSQGRLNHKAAAACSWRSEAVTPVRSDKARGAHDAL